MNFLAMTYYKDVSIPSMEHCLDEMYNISLIIDKLLGTKKNWYEKGYSRKKALEHVVFSGDRASSVVINKLTARNKKNHPIIVEGVWDGESDDKSCSIMYMKTLIHRPEHTGIEVWLSGNDVNYKSMIEFVCEITRNKIDAYAFVQNNGYWFSDRNVFPDRICVGWMLYIPHIILPELIPEAAKVIPVMNEGKQKGTIVVSTEDVFDGNNKEHIAKANDVEIRLLDLGFLPLMTEL